eukprot:m51a1_g7323 hypothetical protein (440) ;mRNA; r:151627-153273
MRSLASSVHRAASIGASRIVDSVVAPEARRVFSQVRELLAAHEKEASAHEVATGLATILLSDGQYPRNADAEAPVAHAEALAIATMVEPLLDHASASYKLRSPTARASVGGSSRAGGEGGSRSPRSDVQKALERVGLTQEALVDASAELGPMCPAHLVVVDAELSAVVVSFRGTKDASDSMTDLLATPVPLELWGCRGRAHEGILESATRKLQPLERAVDKGLAALASAKKHCKPLVYVVGHSLGGGTATLFALLAAQKRPDWEIRCYALSPAAVLSRGLAEHPRTRGVVTSLLYGDDAVPRLSVGSLELLHRVIVHINVQCGDHLHERLSAIALQDTNVSGAVAVSRAECLADPKVQESCLYPAGRVLVLHGFLPAGTPKPKSKEKEHEGKQYAMSEVRDLRLFAEILVTKKMLTNHKMPRLRAAIEFLAAGPACQRK